MNSHACLRFAIGHIELRFVLKLRQKIPLTPGEFLTVNNEIIKSIETTFFGSYRLNISYIHHLSCDRRGWFLSYWNFKIIKTGGKNI